MLEKLEKAKELNAKITELGKQLKVVKDILKNNYDDGAKGLPEIGIRVEPTKMGVMYLDSKYLPVDVLEVINGYTKNISDHKLSIEKELNDLLK